ncbi:glycosyltransferase family 2 protein [Horticoccus luteus]|uniref:Glycosyltransferase family 2 protein n=1 Tax=Horticoccus luteus TaxID=2862869 RepID=A0A8F9XM82_9BACT|nr:glycosyltransferase family 2 protein [Horticoccus luteus]QYM79779.1 glycosyltransferase family 2 protein [Horticoccus luteus]
MNAASSTGATTTAGHSIIVPVYNSAKTLPMLVDAVEQAFLQAKTPFEVILVNDGSHDASWSIITELAAGRPWLRGICLFRNYGQHNALLAGLRNARYNVTVTLDDDLQHPPTEIDKLLAALEEDVDVVYGTPAREQHGLFRDLASLITKLALRSAMGAKTAAQTSAFRVFRTDLRQAFANYGSPTVSIDVLLTWATTRFTSVQVLHAPRFEGKSNYTFGKLVRHALNMTTGFSVLPLQFASMMGFAFTALGITVLAYVVGRYMLFGSAVAGFPFLASIIAMFAGVQLFALGVIGEYLARMHFRIMEKPAYTIRGHVSSEQLPRSL